MRAETRRAAIARITRTATMLRRRATDRGRELLPALLTEERQIVTKTAQPLDRLCGSAFAHAGRLEARRFFRKQLGERRDVRQLRGATVEADASARLGHTARQHGVEILAQLDLLERGGDLASHL